MRFDGVILRDKDGNIVGSTTEPIGDPQVDKWLKSSTCETTN